VLWQLTATVRALMSLAADPVVSAPGASTPSPAPSPNVDADLVTPGVWGFVITAAIMVVVILLIIDMVRRMRRVNYRAEIRQRLADEAAAASGAPARGRTKAASKPRPKASTD